LGGSQSGNRTRWDCERDTNLPFGSKKRKINNVNNERKDTAIREEEKSGFWKKPIEKKGCKASPLVRRDRG